MSSLGSPNPFFIAGKKAYEIERSLRFNSADATMLQRTLGSSGNRRTFTWSGWVKRSKPDSSSQEAIFASTTEVSSGNSNTYMTFYQDKIYLNSYDYSGGGTAYNLTTTQVFRDPSAWYHIVWAVDTTQSTSSNRVKLYINGEQVTSFSTASYPSQNYQGLINNSSYKMTMGRAFPSLTNNSPFNGYMAEINFIDGFQYDPSYFGETNVITGQWNPKKYVGSYGTNGFYLNFSDNSGTTATTLGKDSSGNGNNFTPNNFSVAAGADNDSVEDTPTNNFPTINPLDGGTNALLTNGNLTFKPNSSNGGNFNVFYSTFSMRSGKWYFEVLIVNQNSGTNSIQFGIGSYKYKRDSTNQNGYPGTSGLTFLNVNNSSSSYRIGVVDGSTVGSSISTSSTNDVYGVAFDADNKKVYFYKNGSAEGESSGYNVTDVGTGDFFFFSTLRYSTGGSYSGGDPTLAINFGQRAFSYTAPTGYKALSSANLPDPTIKLPNKHFDTLLWSGNATTSDRSITGLNFQPDWAWTKTRNFAYHHALFDAVRGPSNRLNSDQNYSENFTSGGTLASFNAPTSGNNDGGITWDYGTGNEWWNLSGKNYVSWNWNAGDTDGKTYAVTVVSDSGNKYRFDGFGTSAVTLDLAEGGTYIFNYPSAHPLKFSTTSDGTHGGGSEYTTGVTHNSSTQVTIVVAASAPTLYYYCSIHSGMGGQVNTNSTLGSSNFDGTIQTITKVNASAGFSIVTYTGTGADATIGHGLGVAPNVAITKKRSGSQNWSVKHSAVSGKVGYLDITDPFDNSGSGGGIVSDFSSSTTYSVTRYNNSGNYGNVNESSATYVAYVLSEVAGYSKFGSYTGNGNADGPFIFLGFRPVWVMIKNTEAGSTAWYILDNKRDPDNPVQEYLAAEDSAAEGTYIFYDFLSNGFKLRNTGSAQNPSGQKIIYFAFAESPFKNARAR